MNHRLHRSFPPVLAFHLRTLVVSLATMLVVSATVLPAAAADQDAQLRHFESKVRPLLLQRCGECHGAEKQEGGFRVDSPAALRRGGSSGSTIVAGNPEKSLLVSAIVYKDEALQMPPSGKLPTAEIAVIEEWVRAGAALPEDAGAPLPQKSVGDEQLAEGRRFWAFQPPVPRPLPSVGNSAWSRTAIDRFILEKLESERIAPAADADSATWFRRAAFDLTGLPPDPDAVQALLADTAPDARARVLDRLLASPRYGERYARHWLDIARYADSNGLDENVAYGTAFRYRDYVVTSLNRDKPFDRFLQEQIAGDLLPDDSPSSSPTSAAPTSAAPTSAEPTSAEPTSDGTASSGPTLSRQTPSVPPAAETPTDEQLASRYERLIATGFLALGPKVLAEVDEKKMEMDIVDEQIDVLGRSVLGLTFGCCRCHDHKFDPLSTSDYYALAGIFKSTRTMEHFRKVARWHENPTPTREELDRKAAHTAQVAAKKRTIDERFAAASAEARTKLGDMAPPADLEPLFADAAKADLKRLRDELKALEKAAPVFSTALGVTDGVVAEVPIHVRGSHLSLGQTVTRRFPRVLAGEAAFRPDQSGRLELARWLTRPDHPLTGRVLVNRLWRWHFGQGLVRSTDNFGKLGERPSHPEMLDWLAVDLVRQQWSLKRMHRDWMLSRVYGLSTRIGAAERERDPENRWLARGSVRRLEAEAIRDSLLSVSGGLELSMGGSLLHVKNREYLFDHTSKDGTKYDSPRRSLYLPVIRNNLYDVFQLFDYADASVLNGNRDATTVAPQALFLLNSQLATQASARLADAVQAAATDDAGRVAWLYWNAYGRSPTTAESERALRFLSQPAADGLAASGPTASGPAASGPAASGVAADATSLRTKRAWTSLCQAVLASNEFVYLR
jgi:mono/diheme cytochrome c family protein